MEHEFKAMSLFGGIGGGMLGFLQASEEYKGVTGRFRGLCSIDVDEEACKDYERITGSKSMVMDLFDRRQYKQFHREEPSADWKEVTPEDIRNACNGEYPDVVFTSPPCKGFSGLLPEASAKTPKYQALNELTIRGIFLTVEAFRDNLPGLILLENVPRIQTRGKHLIHQIKSMLKQYGYVFTDGYHDCGEIGGLAQHRKRYLLIARRPDKVNAFVYEPFSDNVKNIGQVLKSLPVPGDTTRGGLMHRLPRLHWKTWVRLALIPAGGDWRDLNNSTYNRAYSIVPCDEVSNTISAVTNVSLPKREKRYPGLYKVLNWDSPSSTIIGQTDIQCGALSVADKRIPIKDKGNRHTSHYKVVAWDEPTGTVTGATHVANGLISVQDTRLNCRPRNGTMGVLSWYEPAKTVIAASDIHAGTTAVADPRIPNNNDKGIFIIEATDGTWHRPLTTYELAMLQGFPTHFTNGTPFQLCGNSDSRWRERIGNAVPPPAAKSIAETMLRALIPSLKKEFVLGFTPIWVSGNKREEVSITS